MLAATETGAASSFATFMDHVAQGFERFGTLILVIGVLWSLVLAVLAWRGSGSGRRAYNVLRQAFDGTLLIALEILVAADLIRSRSLPTDVATVIALRIGAN